ncbi:MAG: di-heme oxidoredictase family protein [Thiohalocapsa sp.]
MEWTGSAAANIALHQLQKISLRDEEPGQIGMKRFLTSSLLACFLAVDAVAVADGPPPATGERLLEEWYSDLPWNQKLSTKDSNLINVPFVLPCEALPQEYRSKYGISSQEECKDKTRRLQAARAMLDYGIVDVMGVYRTDTIYKAGEGPTPDQCQGDRPCVELKLQIQRFHTQTDNDDGYEADVIENNRIDKNIGGKHVVVPSLGFAVTEATIFAPWRNWYTGHYCAKKTDSIITSVCYDDYWTTGHIAPAGNVNDWLRFRPALFWPLGTRPTFEVFCRHGETACDMYLGKVDWDELATQPKVVACRNPPGSGTPLDLSVCEDQIRSDTRNLDAWFSEALTEFDDVGRFPWNAPLPPVHERDNLSTGDEKYNPFIGFYELENSETNVINDSVPFNTKYRYKSPHYVLAKECEKEDYRLARQGDLPSISRLSDCAVNFEIHTSGFHNLWKYLYDPFAQKNQSVSDEAILEINKALPGLAANQYGRTMFLYAGVPEQQVAVSFNTLGDGLSVHDKVYGGSIYIQYLPMVNPADRTLAWRGQDPLKNYQDDFWHAFFMSNHMNQDPDHFIRGIRGRTLWHNEHRSNKLYESWQIGLNKDTKFENILGHVDFPAGFQTEEPGSAPFHGNTCDSCHVRNGSGIPLMPNGELPSIHVNHGMKADYQVRTKDYTYTNIAYPSQAVPSMKMVLFDLDEPPVTNGTECDDDDHTGPDQYAAPGGPAGLLAGLLITEDRESQLYNNKIMNFFGNSLPLDQNDNKLVYDMEYSEISDGDGFDLVVDGRPREYLPKRVRITDTSQITESLVCKDKDDFLRPKPNGVSNEIWPENCNEVSGDAIKQAIDDGKIGFLHLIGRRLGNTPLIEMIPDADILEARRRQSAIGSVRGCLSLAPGTRRGKGEADYNYRTCASGQHGDRSDDCYIGRWGWIGDRASLEDQVANAAHVEMNITSVESYNKIHPNPSDNAQLVRYDQTLCGPANERCGDLRPNSDITEREIRDMATYQRWIGIPNRSEYQVASTEVEEGERIFKELQCDSCHVIDKITFDYGDNVLPWEEREHLQRLEIRGEDGVVEYPFISYLGTDLLMHDMGYLSQVAPAPEIVRNRGESIRGEDGRVKPRFRNYVQYLRTPALKGLRFNRFVTDSNHNTKNAAVPLKKNFTPGCDFLLHDGRACDAIEAAYLHDGPAVKQLNMIERLNSKSRVDLDKLRAFLYSL